MILEYIRMISYAMVIIVSVFSLPYTPTHRFLVVANIIMGTGSLLSLFHVVFFMTDPVMARNYILTPISLIWAALVFINFIKK